jgi:hypothetical protein
MDNAMTDPGTMRLGKSGFEIETCGRCGGGGRYSYNQMDGDRCYGCGGSGVRLTKRGKAALDFYLASLMRPISDVNAGDLFRSADSGKWKQITEIRTDGSKALINGEWVPYVFIMTASGAHGYLPGASVWSVQTMDEQSVKLAAAADYQRTLTKTGNPRKSASALRRARKLVQGGESC